MGNKPSFSSVLESEYKNFWIISLIQCAAIFLKCIKLLCLWLLNSLNKLSEHIILKICKYYIYFSSTDLDSGC